MASVLKKIGTHDGVFHCDEVLACFMLKRLPEFTYSEIIRTREKSILDTCDVVVDVGGVYDPQNHRYDHHQRSFQHTMNTLVPSRPWNVKLSSAGLIYHHFGEKILECILGPPQDAEIIKNLFAYVYENFVQEVDAIDNGVQMFDGEPKYRIHTSISSRVGNLNPTWNSDESYDSQKTFHVAMDLVGREFIDRIHYFTKSWWPARSIVKESVDDRNTVHISGEILELKEFCPWIEHLNQIEKEMNITGQIKFTIFKDKDKNEWRVRAVPVEPGSFQCRVFLKEQWQGLRGDELDEISGIKDCIFVHHAGFIGGHKTREGVLEMALKSLKSHEKN